MTAQSRHSPYEFRETHTTSKTRPVVLRPVAEESAGAHDHDHGGHGDDPGDEGRARLRPEKRKRPSIMIHVARPIVIQCTAQPGPGEDDRDVQTAEVFADNTVHAAQAHSFTQTSTKHSANRVCATAGANKTIVANHNAYSYISVRYGVDIMTVHGLDPEGEPSPAGTRSLTTSRRRA